VSETLVRGHESAGAPPEERFLYGIIAEFEDADHVIAAAKRAYEAGYRKMDAYTPFPVEGLSEALGFRDVYIPTMMLVAGILGCIGGFGLIYYCLGISYPLNIGGRPIMSWPYYLPITFECTVLAAALAGVFGMFAINGLPQPYHPVFDAPEFHLATSSRFFLCIEHTDPHFDRDATRRFMDSLGAERVSEVELRK
jgi:hypothetical protein